jgi:hypothetical protein
LRYRFSAKSSSKKERENEQASERRRKIALYAEKLKRILTVLVTFLIEFRTVPNFSPSMLLLLLLLLLLLCEGREREKKKWNFRV